MDKKYIIKNCPSYHTFYPNTASAKPFSCCDTELPYKKCQDYTACLLKQVVENCKKEITPCIKTEKQFIYNVETNKHEYINGEVEEYKDGYELANNILQLFEIEECER